MNKLLATSERGIFDAQFHLALARSLHMAQRDSNVPDYGWSALRSMCACVLLCFRGLQPAGSKLHALLFCFHRAPTSTADDGSCLQPLVCHAGAIHVASSSWLGGTSPDDRIAAAFVRQPF